MISSGDRLEGTEILHWLWRWMHCCNSVRHEGEAEQVKQPAWPDPEQRAEPCFPLLVTNDFCPSCVGLGLLRRAKVLPGRAAPCTTPQSPLKTLHESFGARRGNDLGSDLCLKIIVSRKSSDSIQGLYPPSPVSSD